MRRKTVFGSIFTIFLMIVLVNNQAYAADDAQNIQDKSTIQEPTSAITNLKIMASINIVQDIVQNIVGELGTVEAIVGGNQDIHDHPGPTDIQKTKMGEADIFFAMGLEDLEPWLEDTLDNLGGNAPYVVNLIKDDMIKADSILGGPNPHVWLNPNNVKTMSDNITLELTALDSGNQANFESNNATYSAKLDSLLTRISGNATVLSGKKVSVIHPAFKYLLDLLGIVRVDVLEKVEGEEPTTADIQNFITKINDENVEMLIHIPWTGQDEANEIARETEIKIAYLAPLIAGTDNNDNPITNYIQMMDYNLWALNNPQDPPASIPGYSIFILLISFGLRLFLLKRKIYK